MNREKLKLIVRNLELLVDSLKSEIYSDLESYKPQEGITSNKISYSDMFEDDDD